MRNCTLPPPSARKPIGKVAYDGAKNEGKNDILGGQLFESSDTRGLAAEDVASRLHLSDRLDTQRSESIFMLPPRTPP